MLVAIYNPEIKDIKITSMENGDVRVGLQMKDCDNTTIFLDESQALDLLIQLQIVMRERAEKAPIEQEEKDFLEEQQEFIRRNTHV